MTRQLQRVVVRAAAALLVLVAFAPAFVSAQPVATENASGLGAPEPGVRRAPRRRSRDRDRGAGDEAAAEPLTPRFELGYLHYSLTDGFGGGKVHMGTFGGYLPTGPARLGATAELGVRTYELGADEMIGRLTLLAGYQHLGWGRFRPFVAATGSLGFRVAERFSTTDAWVVGGAGLELGADLTISGPFWMGMSFGYQHLGTQGLGFDVLTLRIRAGL